MLIGVIVGKNSTFYNRSNLQSTPLLSELVGQWVRL